MMYACSLRARSTASAQPRQCTPPSLNVPRRSGTDRVLVLAVVMGSIPGKWLPPPWHFVRSTAFLIRGRIVHDHIRVSQIGRSPLAYAAREAAQGGEVGFDVGEPCSGVSNKLVEVFHNRLFGQDRQVVEWSFANLLVEPPVEGRTGEGVLPQQSELPCLVGLEPLSSPQVPLTQPVAQRQDLQNDLRVHRFR